MHFKRAFLRFLLNSFGCISKPVLLYFGINCIIIEFYNNKMDFIHISLTLFWMHLKTHGFTFHWILMTVFVTFNAPIAHHADTGQWHSQSWSPHTRLPGGRCSVWNMAHTRLTSVDITCPIYSRHFPWFLENSLVPMCNLKWHGWTDWLCCSDVKEEW